MKREHAYNLKALLHKASSYLSDNDALDGIELFPLWGTNKQYEVGNRLRYNERLYKVLQNHISQADWLPNITPSLYAEVERQGQGDTPDNPIPYNNNMELLENKYYLQDNVVYYCFRGTGVPVYNNLVDLIGLYVEVYVG